MPDRPRKSSARVTLVLLGAAALGSCSDPIDTRDVYASRAECVQDWGDEQKCEPVRDGRYSTSHYYGPRYSSSRTSEGITGPRTGSRAVASSHVSRGGFGASASSHSGGG